MVSPSYLSYLSQGSKQTTSDINYNEIVSCDILKLSRESGVSITFKHPYSKQNIHLLIPPYIYEKYPRGAKCAKEPLSAAIPVFIKVSYRVSSKAGNR